MKKKMCIALMPLLVACNTTPQSSIEKTAATHQQPQLLNEQIEFSASFIFRYKDIFNAQQKRVLWDVASQNYQLSSKGSDQGTALSDKKTEYQKYSLVGSVFSSLRTANYVSGIITYKEDDLFHSPTKPKKFAASVFKQRVIPAFDSIGQDYNLSYTCVYGCSEETANKVYEFTPVSPKNSNDNLLLPGRLFASVCVGRQKAINKLNSPFYDPNKLKTAIHTHSYDGFNIVFTLNNSTDNKDFSDPANLESITQYNKRCLAPQDAMDAFSTPGGRALYRSVSKYIPEYFATMEFSNEYALYQGHIWKLSNVGDARRFHGIKTTN